MVVDFLSFSFKETNFNHFWTVIPTRLPRLPRHPLRSQPPAKPEPQAMSPSHDLPVSLKMPGTKARGLLCSERMEAHDLWPRSAGKYY